MTALPVGNKVEIKKPTYEFKDAFGVTKSDFPQIIRFQFAILRRLPAISNAVSLELLVGKHTKTKSFVIRIKTN